MFKVKGQSKIYTYAKCKQQCTKKKEQISADSSLCALMFSYKKESDTAVSTIINEKLHL